MTKPLGMFVKRPAPFTMLLPFTAGFIPEDIPNLALFPTRLHSFNLYPDMDAGNMEEDLMYRVRAEQERLMRLLPPAPYGYHWQFELQAAELYDDFEHNTFTVRVRCRLHNDKTGERLGTHKMG